MSKGLIILLFPFLCFSQVKKDTFNFKYFTLEYDFEKLSPTWVEYRLVDTMFLQKTKHKRIGFFKIKGLKTAGAKEYKKSGYDRGHVYPHAHASFDKVGANQSMAYLNMTPQSPFINRTLIKALEAYEREVAKELGCIDVRLTNIFGKDTLRGMTIPDKFIRKISDCKGKEISNNVYLHVKKPKKKN